MRYIKPHILELQYEFLHIIANVQNIYVFVKKTLASNFKVPFQNICENQSLAEQWRQMSWHLTRHVQG